MDITTAYEGQQATVTVGGHLNTNTAAELEDELANVFGTTHEVVLDFTNLEYLSSAGLRVLVAALKRVKAAGGSLHLINVCPDVREVFEITGLIDMFDVD